MSVEPIVCFCVKLLWNYYKFMMFFSYFSWTLIWFFSLTWEKLTRMFAPTYVFVYNSIFSQWMSLWVFLIGKRKPLHYWYDWSTSHKIVWHGRLRSYFPSIPDLPSHLKGFMGLWGDKVSSFFLSSKKSLQGGTSAAKRRLIWPLPR